MTRTWDPWPRRASIRSGEWTSHWLSPPAACPAALAISTIASIDPRFITMRDYRLSRLSVAQLILGRHLDTERDIAVLIGKRCSFCTNWLNDCLRRAAIDPDFR